MTEHFRGSRGGGMQLFHLFRKRSGRMLWLAIIFGVLSGVLNSGLLAVVNSAIASRELFSPRAARLFAVLCVAATLSRVASEHTLASLGQRAICSLRVGLSRQVIATALQQLEQIGAHRIMSVLTDDIPTIANAAGSMPLICINAGVIAGCLCYMGWLQWKLLAAILCLMAVGICTYQLGLRRAIQAFQRARRRDSDLQLHFRGLIFGIKELKLHESRSQMFLTSALSRTAQDVCDANVSGFSTFIVTSSWGQLLVFTAIALAAFSGSGRSATSVPVGFCLALLYLMSPLQMVMNSLPALTRANVALANTRSLGFELAAEEPVPDAAAPALAADAPIRLELAGVTYSYRTADTDESFTLGPLDLTVNAGEILFIVGGNGSGKTTLAKIIAGLYVPQSGELWCNHQPITDENRHSYSQLFSAIFSDFFLFESLFGLEQVNLDPLANEYLARLHLDHNVRVQDGVLSTTDLSQGQRKRLALLTSWLEDRPICFFDEWAADQDPAFKAVFYDRILPELRSRGKAVIVITHDDRYYGTADRLVKLESGKLIATHGIPARSAPDTHSPRHASGAAI